MPETFLEDIIREQGFYQQPPHLTGGIPSTKQEEAFIFDFMETRGRAPTPGEVTRGFSSTFDMSEAVFTPESTMGKLGFKTFAEYVTAQRVDETFGPWAGSFVPEGGTVLTKDGTPYLRTFRPEGFQAQIDRGEFIDPRGPQDPLETIAFDPSQVYPTYDRGPFKPPSMEEALGQYSPQQVYQARLEDYLGGQFEQDAPKVKELQDLVTGQIARFDRRLKLGEITTEQYNKWVLEAQDYFKSATENLMTEDRLREIATEAAGLFRRGERAEALPFFQESLGTTGASVQELYNQLLRGQPSLNERGFERRDKAGNIIYTGGLEEQFQQQQAAIPEFKGYPVPELETGTEQRDFLTYVERLGIAPELQNWLRGRYQEYFQLWRDRGQGTTFMDFVRDILKRGG